MIGISIIIGEVIVTLIIILFDLLGDSCWRKNITGSNESDNINSGNYSSQSAGTGSDHAAMLGFILGQSHGYGQINGHNDAFYNNICVLNTESTINCGIFNCNNETNKNVWPILGNNTVILVSNDVNYTVPEQEFQQKYPGNDVEQLLKHSLIMHNLFHKRENY